MHKLHFKFNSGVPMCTHSKDLSRKGTTMLSSINCER